MSSPTRVDVCVCTFRRPSLASTLRSIAAQTLRDSVQIRVIVVDNDETPSARDLAEQVCLACGLTLLYVHGPARNISIARNLCLARADAPFVAFIDDDETASPGWLAALMHTMQTSGADIVLGPVQARYNAGSPVWLAQADLHSIRPVIAADGTIRTGYTCNVLLRAELLRTSPPPRFAESLGRSGGEDTVFFDELYAAGARLVFSPEAVAFEDVPPNRQRMSYLVARAFRMGQTHGRVLTRQLKPGRVFGRAAAIATAWSKCAFCLLATLAAVGSMGKWRRQFFRAALHAGVVAKLCGLRDVTQY